MYKCIFSLKLNGQLIFVFSLFFGLGFKAPLEVCSVIRNCKLINRTVTIPERGYFSSVPPGRV